MIDYTKPIGICNECHKEFFTKEGFDIHNSYAHLIKPKIQPHKTIKLMPYTPAPGIDMSLYCPKNKHPELIKKLDRPQNEHLSSYLRYE